MEKELTVKQITSKINQTQKKIDEINRQIKMYKKWIAEAEAPDAKDYKRATLSMDKKCLRDAEKKLNKYEAQMAELKLLQVGKVKEYPVLRQFVENWKQYCIKTIADPEIIKKCIAARKEMYEDIKKVEEEYKAQGKPLWSSYNKCESIKHDFNRSWGFVADYMIWSEERIDMERLEKDYTYFAEQKYNKFIEDCEFYVGEITDTSDLSIGDKGDINGHVVGVKATANVNTISAEGPIQRFHYRTLFKMVK